MELGQVFAPGTIILNLESSDKDELFEEMVESIVSVHPSVNRDEAVAALKDRESQMSTGIMHGIGVPHGSCPSVDGIIGAIGISRKGIDYESLDKAPVNVVFMMLHNPGETEKHLSALKLLASVLQNPQFIRELLTKESSQAVYDCLCEYEKNIAG